MANDEIKTELGTTTREEMDAALRNARPSPSGHGLTMEVSWATRQALRDAHASRDRQRCRTQTQGFQEIATGVI